MTSIEKLMIWPRPKQEVLIYALLLLRECKTKQDVEMVCKDSVIHYQGYGEALLEIFEYLPQILKTLNAIYGVQKGGEQ